MMPTIRKRKRHSVPADALVLFICDPCGYPFAVKADELGELSRVCTRCSQPMRLVSVAEAE